MNDLLVPLQNGWVAADQLADIMRERGVTRITLPGTYSSEQIRRMREIRDSHYFLVRNRGGQTGERYRCTVKQGHNCNGLHEFFTYMGVDRPFKGLDGALYGYSQLVRDSRLARKLLAWAPHLDASHPYMAHAIQPKEPGVDLIAVAIGVLEPISQARAEALVRQINSKRPPVPVRL